MGPTSAAGLVAVDIGNSRVKFGLFDGSSLGAIRPGRLPAPTATLELARSEHWLGPLAGWLAESAHSHRWWIGSVERTLTSQLIDWLQRQPGQPPQRPTLLASVDLPLVVSLPRPDMVGIDRLLAAVAVNHLRPQDRPAVIVDLGTAITVDLLSPAGAFMGGAILPGIGLSARALHEFTDLLPLLDMPGLGEPPAALGTTTMEALRSGIYWGAIGGVRQLIELLSPAPAGDCQVYLTGGAAPAVAGRLSPSAVFEPHLTLAGIALSAVL